MSAFLPERLKTLDYWITERESMRKRHAATIRPYTRDPLLAEWRFCNVRRLDDHVSRWLMRYWYVGERAKPSNSMSAATLARRCFNLPDTLVELLDVPWADWGAIKAKLQARTQRRGAKVFDPAYKIGGGGNGTEKYEAVIDLAATVHETCFIPSTRSMRETWADLCGVKGIKTFTAGQIVADLRHVLPGEWRDKNTWAPMGPGSTKGMLYLLGRDSGSLSQVEFEKHLRAVIDHVHETHLNIYRDRKLEAHDVQNVLCEISKYVRLKAGGKAKQRYRPRREVTP